MMRLPKLLSSLTTSKRPRNRFKIADIADVARGLQLGIFRQDSYPSSVSALVSTTTPAATARRGRMS